MNPLRLDHDSPVPIYHQIVEAIRYRIATGRLSVGERLPSARSAAELWKVHFHTVRRAYSELARMGIVSVDGARGTHVAGPPARSSRSGSELEHYLDGVVEQARDRFRLSASQVANYLNNRSRLVAAESGVISIVECNVVQCEELAAQVGASYEVVARPWCLDQGGDPPAGPILATYFHYDEISRRWPDRLAEIHFLSIRPDPFLRRRVLELGRARKIILVERDRELARHMAADVGALFPSTLHDIAIKTPRDPARVLRSAGRRQPVLFAPRVWNDLPETVRSDPRAFEVRYCFQESELAPVAAHLRWSRSSAPSAIASERCPASLSVP